MARIGIVKVRMPHDVQWHTGWAMRQLLRLPGLGPYRRKLMDLEGKPFMPQLTLTYLAGMGAEICERRGWDHRFEIIDDRLEYINVEGLDMLWMTVSTPNAFASYEVADRALALGIPVVLGGVHPTLMHEEAQRHCTSLVRGEAEGVLEKLLEDFEARQLQPVYRAPHLAELRELAQPRWDLMPADYYRWIVPVQTSRGCRNACTFCSTTRMQGARRRHRPVADVVAEIAFLREREFLAPEKIIFFTDNNIAYDDRDGGTTYARALFTALRPLNIHWAGQAEIGIADDPGLVRLAAESGCQTLLVGFESLSQGNLDGVRKSRCHVDSYRRNIRQLHRHGISIIGCFVFGFDDDEADVFDRTADFIGEQVDIPQLSLLTPFPGTGLYKAMARDGRILHHDWSKYDITHVCFRPARMTPREAEEGYQRLSERIFSLSGMLERALRSGSRRLGPDFQDLTLSERIAGVLAPNLIYKRLSAIGR
jgi:radical SAM superfamily enzyme YgiQ (UPF0313 family)